MGNSFFGNSGTINWKQYVIKDTDKEDNTNNPKKKESKIMCMPWHIGIKQIWRNIEKQLNQYNHWRWYEGKSEGSSLYGTVPSEFPMHV